VETGPLFSLSFLSPLSFGDSLGFLGDFFGFFGVWGSLEKFGGIFGLGDFGGVVIDTHFLSTTGGIRSTFNPIQSDFDGRGSRNDRSCSQF
jgi:hypothetical protein